MREPHPARPRLLRAVREEPNVTVARAHPEAHVREPLRVRQAGLLHPAARRGAGQHHLARRHSPAPPTRRSPAGHRSVSWLSSSADARPCGYTRATPSSTRTRVPSSERSHVPPRASMARVSGRRSRKSAALSGRRASPTSSRPRPAAPGRPTRPTRTPPRTAAHLGQRMREQRGRLRRVHRWCRPAADERRRARALGVEAQRGRGARQARRHAEEQGAPHVLAVARQRRASAGARCSAPARPVRGHQQRHTGLRDEAHHGRPPRSRADQL
jgi:hypothetical protein